MALASNVFSFHGVLEKSWQQVATSLSSWLRIAREALTEMCHLSSFSYRKVSSLCGTLSELSL